MWKIIEKAVEILTINKPNPDQRIDYRLTLKGKELIEARKVIASPENPSKKPV